MFWIAHELRNPKMALNIGLSFSVENLTAFTNDAVIKSDDTASMLPI